MKTPYITNYTSVADISIPTVSTRLAISDFLGAVRVRWGIRRDNYRVNPGLYAIGTPGAGSDVFVTANYKLSFDHLRKSLAGLDGWILVLDTRGVNVWCAAGKGTFSTKELVRQVRLASLDRVVNHRRLILPQLGATGIAAHKVKDETGFNVKYGPVRASDLKQFIESGYRAGAAMRKISFDLGDRVKLIPNDFFGSRNYLFGALLLLVLLSGLDNGKFNVVNIRENGFHAVLKVFLGYCSGTILTPLLLPYLPGRYFSLKGYFSGAALFAILLFFLPSGDNFFEDLSWFFIVSAISSFIAMNFTGSSTYTSLSGVKKEMKIFVPVQIGFAIIGIVLQVTGKLINQH